MPELNLEQKVDLLLEQTMQILELLNESKIILEKKRGPFPQHCVNCSLDWNSRTEKPVQCPNCHNHPTILTKSRRIQQEGLKSKEILCQDFDGRIRSGKRLIASIPGLQRKYVFTVQPDGRIMYEKVSLEAGQEVVVENKLCDSSFEVLRSFGDLEAFFRQIQVEIIP